jgi:hypothetical protein
LEKINLLFNKPIREGLIEINDNHISAIPEGILPPGARHNGYHWCIKKS